MDDKLEQLEENSQTSSEIASTWNSSQEVLLAAIGDRSNCYRWMHNKCQAVFESFNFYLTMPSIVVSTLAGSATIGLPTMFPDPTVNKYVSISVGLLTLSTGILTSINQ